MSRFTKPVVASVCTARPFPASMVACIGRCGRWSSPAAHGTSDDPFGAYRSCSRQTRKPTTTPPASSARLIGHRARFAEAIAQIDKQLEYDSGAVAAARRAEVVAAARCGLMGRSL